MVSDVVIGLAYRPDPRRARPDGWTRLTVAQGELLFGALTAAGCETELVVLPGEGHVPASRRHALEAIRRTQAWFDRFMGPVG